MTRENRNQIARFQDRHRKLMQTFPEADIQLNCFIGKFLDQFDDIRRHNATLGFHWIDESKPQTIENLSWSEDVKEAELRRQQIAARKAARQIPSTDLTVQQWIEALRNDRAA